MNGFAVFWGLDWRICGACFSRFQNLVSGLETWLAVALLWPCVSFLSYRVPAHYVYPQAFVQPSVVIPHVQPSAATATAAAATSPYLDYTGAAYAQYSAAAATAAAAAAAAYEQYPYAASPAPTSYMTTAGYGYTVQQPLATAATPGAAAAAAAFSQYQPQQLQTDRMQWNSENCLKGGEQGRSPCPMKRGKFGGERTKGLNDGCQSWVLTWQSFYQRAWRKSPKIRRQMMNIDVYFIQGWSVFFVTIEYIWIFNIYSLGKYLIIIEVDSLDLMSTIAELCIYQVHYVLWSGFFPTSFENKPKHFHTYENRMLHHAVFSIS